MKNIYIVLIAAMLAVSVGAEKSKAQGTYTPVWRNDSISVRANMATAPIEYTAWNLYDRFSGTLTVDSLSGRRTSNGRIMRVSPLDLPASNDVNTKLSLKANLASPTFTGSVTVPTPTTSSQAATKGYVDGLIKRQETYSGTTIAAGTYTVTFSTAYPVAPNIQANIINGTDSQNIRTTNITTTGFTVLVRNRVDVVGLLPTWVNVSGATVDVLITAK